MKATKRRLQRLEAKRKSTRVEPLTVREIYVWPGQEIEPSTSTGAGITEILVIVPEMPEEYENV